MHKVILIFLLLFIHSNLSLAQNNAALIDIGDGGVSSISKDGKYVCGSNWPNPPFIWSQTSGRLSVGNVEGESYGVSNNGIVVGRFRDSSLIVGGEPVLRAGYFDDNQWYSLEGIQGVPPLDAISFTHCYGINSDGTKAVGMVWHPNWRVEACYWSIPDTGIGLLGQAGGYNSRANVISNDGSIIAGWDGLSTGADRRAFYWDPSPHFLGNLYPNDPLGESRGMNSDGSVIVGGSVWPFIWTAATGMQQVTADSSDWSTGQAIAISDNGTIVGYVDPGGFNYQAFIKKQGWSDIVYMRDFIEDSLNITTYPNWYFAFGQAISADGNVIGITAYPPGSGIAHALILNLDTTVPVELTSFTANSDDQNILLNWTTATETNNSGFEIQRKIDMGEWTVIGFVSGRGSTTERSTYSYSDPINSSGKYSYRLKQIDFDGTCKFSDVVEVEVSLPVEYNLAQNYPNPFNPSSSITFTIRSPQFVTLKVYDVLGNEITTLVKEEKPAGTYEIEFDAGNLPSGIYFYKLNAESPSPGSVQRYVETKKMVLIK